MLANNDIQKLYARSEQLRGTSGLASDKTFVQETVVSRMRFIILIAILITLAVAGRLIYMNTASSNFLTQQMNSRVLRTVKIIPMRGTLTDRNNNPLAVSTPVASIWVDPTELDNITPEQITKAASILGMSVANLNQKLNQKDKTFVYIKRAVTPEQADKIKSLDIEGIYSLQEYKRFYPYSDVAAHVVGFTNVDDKGAEGMEYADNKELTGVEGAKQIIRDRQGNVVDDLGNQKAAVDGKTVALSIDNNIQYFAYDALKKQVAKSDAKGGAAVVLDAKTGEVLAMVNMPSYNPNNLAGVGFDAIRNRAAIDIYEPGSIIKPLLVAAALNEGVVTPDTKFNTHPYSIGPKLIKDNEPFPSLTVSQIVQHSSDIGASKIGLELQPQYLWNYYHDIGFGTKLDTHFPGEASGILRPWKDWRRLDQAEMSFGYSIAVSLMQMAHAYTIFTNNGCILPVSFYKLNATPACKQVISPKTSDEVQQMLATVVSAGTGRSAQVDGYTAAGKTGTAQILTGHGYSDKAHYGSFVGYAPAVNPRIIIAVTIDDARKGGYYGAATAAPVFTQIASRALPYLGVKSDKAAIETVVKKALTK